MKIFIYEQFRKMDNKTKLAGTRTALKMAVNILERLELKQDDWKVGCKCANMEKLIFVKNILSAFLNCIDNSLIVLNVLEDNILEVECPKISKGCEEEFQNLVVSVSDIKENSSLSETELRGTETPSASSASTDDEEEKVFKSIDDMISCFQKDL